MGKTNQNKTKKKTKKRKRKKKIKGIGEETKKSFIRISIKNRRWPEGSSTSRDTLTHAHTTEETLRTALAL